MLLLSSYVDVQVSAQITYYVLVPNLRDLAVNTIVYLEAMAFSPTRAQSLLLAQPQGTMSKGYGENPKGSRPR